MIADSLKCKGFACFLSDWAGFDELKPINVIIGRNNSGKSQLLDFIHSCCIHEPVHVRRSLGTSAELRIEGKFGRDTALRGLGVKTKVAEEYWETYGQQFADARCRVEQSPNNVLQIESLEYEGKDPGKLSGILNQIRKHPHAIEIPIFGSVFRRIMADRDVKREPPSNELALGFDGSGASNLIRRCILSTSLDENLVQEHLLKALDDIFGEDGNFKQIEIRNDDEPADTGSDDLWEVYLGEPSKGLIPLSKSGSGLKTVILVLLNLLVYPQLSERDPEKKFVYAFEELENNLHPALLRRLFRFLVDHVRSEGCMLFLTTHSSVALDFFGTLPDCQITHVKHDGTSASTKSLQTHFDKVGLVHELGARPSDLLQANGIVWLEGPSDRIYFNRFIELFSSGKLIEGRDYQCAFYGGSLLAKTAFKEPAPVPDNFANLLRLNSNIVVVCDSDRLEAGSKLKPRVVRIQNEVELIPNAKLWITQTKEIENYVPGGVWAKVYEREEALEDPNQFDKFPTRDLDDACYVFRVLRYNSFDKCDFASEAREHLSLDCLKGRFDLETQMHGIVTTIQSWNDS